VRSLFVRQISALLVVGGLALACGPSGEDNAPTRSVQSSASTCRAPSASQAFHLVEAFPDVKLERPTSIAHAGGDVFFVTEQSGKVRRIAKQGERFASTVVLDLSSRLPSENEMGLLGIALSPDFASTGELFVSHTGQPSEAHGSIGQTTLARYVSRDGGLTVDVASEEIMIALDRDVANHNGGRVAFGPDRLLYFSIGDGSWGDLLGRVQDPHQLFGKILRLDALGGHPYRIPPDNPYAAGGGRPEVFARGFRNPWTFSFDKKGRLWLADVGNDNWEEIDVVTRGGNYGWPAREGRHCLFGPPCEVPGATEPVFEYPHSDGFSITGGFVYRGKHAALEGAYVFSDFMTGRVWALDSNAPTTSRLLFDSGLFISNFGEDADGELLVLDFAGRVMRIEPSQAKPDPGPVSLRDLGCLVGETGVASTLLPYDVIAPLWSDGLDKRRWVSLPINTSIHVKDDASWELPVGSMLLKEFASAGRRIETRMLVRDVEAGWVGYAFQWNDAQTDAVLLSDSKVVDIAGAPWTIPGPAQCGTCHVSRAGSVLGFNVEQLNRDVTFGSGLALNQVARLGRIKALDRQVDPSTVPSFRDPYGTKGTLDERARAYLNANCATCHRPFGGPAAGLDLRSSVAAEAMGLICRLPTRGNLGDPGALLVAPGHPERSILYRRMASLGDERMPRLGSHRLDMRALTLIHSWIASLPPCP
jgi:uncharacterized repeat protein (TIGR03806 family)